MSSLDDFLKGIQPKKMSEEEIEFNRLEVAYIKSQDREVEINANRDLFPADWSSNNNYDKKTEILKEAIEKKCLITETVGYLDIIEGVKDITETEDPGEER